MCALYFSNHANVIVRVMVQFQCERMKFLGEDYDDIILIG